MILPLQATETVRMVTLTARDYFLEYTVVEPAALLRSTMVTAAAVSQRAVESLLPTSQSTTRTNLCARPCVVGNTYAALLERFPTILESQMQMELVRLTRSKTMMTAVKLPLLIALQLTTSKNGTLSRGAGRDVPVSRLVVSAD